MTNPFDPNYVSQLAQAKPERRGKHMRGRKPSDGIRREMEAIFSTGALLPMVRKHLEGGPMTLAELHEALPHVELRSLRMCVYNAAKRGHITNLNRGTNRDGLFALPSESVTSQRKES